MLYYIIFGLIWFATLAMMVREGVWNNLIALAQIILSGLLAFGFYQPLSTLLDSRSGGELTYFMDFVSIWAIYCLSMLIMKILDAALSKKRVAFPAVVDNAVGPAIGALAGLVLGSIVMASMHTAPMPEDFMSGKLKHNPGEVNTASSLTSPDLGWLRLVEQVSTAGALGTGAEFKVKDFVAIYGDRRKKFEKLDSLSVDRK